MADHLRVAARLLAEMLITLGLVSLLFVGYQLWWTNVTARDYARRQVDTLRNQWSAAPPATQAHPPYPETEPAGERFAIITIPKLNVRTAIAEGIDRQNVLNDGLVGHYSGPLQTAFPWDPQGNFALAAHRNSHGEPFRYIDELDPGDTIVVETRYDSFTYQVTRTLPRTSPDDTSVIEPVPPRSGFDGPGRYITLTTCTPQFTSAYRLVVWGRLMTVTPRTATAGPSPQDAPPS